MNTPPSADNGSALHLVPSRRVEIGAAAFAHLRAASGNGQGEPLYLPVGDIDEDPHQPRTVVDEEALASLAASMTLHGVVQPIVVRATDNGRYRLVVGARRLRAARLAGLVDIPAVIRSHDTQDFAAQVIENQQRASLANSDLLAAIERFVADGYTNPQIATLCGLKDYQVAAFRQAGHFPPALRARIDRGDIRALYDLFRQWTKTPEAVLARLPDLDTAITVTQARRIISDITGKSTGSLVLDRMSHAAAVLPAGRDTLQDGGPVPTRNTVSGPNASTTLNGANTANKANKINASKASTAPEASPGGMLTFIVQGHGTEHGQLVMDQRPEREGYALVRFAAGVEEVALSALRVIRIA